ncbi:hypothetical protein L1987_51106 [Smallanthus sonchifolius]|uniref:Uncharacterized protein n=1 Tax=Smallanthus sonchifolius TaxID=185202 RepID=A0ACB9EQI2_9ASTR|nr:hypothetical protein L1987_51106 [Smallanthus sonchifolius]
MDINKIMNVIVDGCVFTLMKIISIKSLYIGSVGNSIPPFNLHIGVSQILVATSIEALSQLPSSPPRHWRSSSFIWYVLSLSRHLSRSCVSDSSACGLSTHALLEAHTLVPHFVLATENDVQLNFVGLFATYELYNDLVAMAANETCRSFWKLTMPMNED